MAKNGRAGHGRIATIKNRSQIQNHKTGQFTKINNETGKFMSGKATPYKGVRKNRL